MRKCPSGCCHLASPARSTKDYWLVAHVHPQSSTFGRTVPGHVELRTVDQLSPEERSGKWLIFVPRPDIDALWKTISSATREGRLGPASKVSTAKGNPNAKEKDNHVICVYTTDHADEADVMRVRKTLRGLGITWKIPYKTDAATHAGRYAVRGDKRISKYYV